MIDIGVYENLSNEDYHADKNSISRSAIMDFDKSPYNYWAKHLNPDRPNKDATPQMKFGSAFHMYCLEPQLFRQHYAITPLKVLLKDVGREKYEEYKTQCEELEKHNKIIIEQDDYTKLSDMLDRINYDKSAMALIHDARIEHSFFWEDEHSGLMVKARPDILHDNMIVDLKTASDASPRAFQRAMVEGGYHIQAAIIRDGVFNLEGNRINTAINIVVETKYPYNIGIYIIDEAAIDEGHMKYKQILLDIKAAKHDNRYNDYGIQKIGLPKWAL